MSPTFSLAALGAYVIKLRSRLCIRRAQDPTLEIQAGFSSKNHKMYLCMREMEAGGGTGKRGRVGYLFESGRSRERGG